MKFGQQMLESMVKEWEPYYMRYNLLKKIIKKLEERHVSSPQERSYFLSISIPPSTNAAAQPQEGSLEAGDPSPMQEEFFKTLEKDMKSVQDFTDRRLQIMRDMLEAARQLVQKANETRQTKDRDTAKAALDNLGEEVLRLEKFVNLNFTGFQKILKKHDRRLPSPCRAFYTKRLQAQPWVRISSTEIISVLGELYAELRGERLDAASPLNTERRTPEHSRQLTKRYWLRAEDVTSVQTRILQHLLILGALKAPGSSEGTAGAQLTTTLYLDNHALEFYKARVEDLPGVSSIQLRWYDTAKPSKVVVERKANALRASGDREVVQDSFVMDAEEVSSLFGSDASHKGNRLAEEVVQMIQAKQLVPTARVQCMRTTFANPAGSLLLTLDTNMAMILERTPDSDSVRNVAETGVWSRDPTKAISADHVRQFPHAILEVRINKEAGAREDSTRFPPWLEDLLRSSAAREVVGFSPYVHSVALLLPEDVEALPGWARDSSLGAASLEQGGMGATQTVLEGASSRLAGADRLGTPVLSGNRRRLARLGRRRITGVMDDERHPTTSEVCAHIFCGCFISDPEVVEPQILRGEVKVVLANERTYLRQLHISLPLAAIGTSVRHLESLPLIFVLEALACGAKQEEACICPSFNSFFFPISKAMAKGSNTFVEISGGVLLAVVLLYLGLAMYQHQARGRALRERIPTKLESSVGPLLITGAVVASVLSYFSFVFVGIATGEHTFDQVSFGG